MAYLFAFPAAYAITFVDLWSGGYRRTFSFLVKCPSAHVLAFVYALIACALVALFDVFVAPSVASANDNSAVIAQFLAYLSASPIAKGIFVGLFANGLANLKLFNVPAASGSFPIGIQTLTQMFDEPLREGAAIQHLTRVKAFAATYLTRISKTDNDLPALIKLAQDNVPGTYAIDRKAAIKADFGDSTMAVDLIRKALERFGEEWVKSTIR